MTVSPMLANHAASVNYDDVLQKAQKEIFVKIATISYIPEDRRQEVQQAAKEFAAAFLDYRLQNGREKKVTLDEYDESFTNTLEKAAGDIKIPDSSMDTIMEEYGGLDAMNFEQTMEFIRERSLDDSWEGETLDGKLEVLVEGVTEIMIQRDLNQIQK